MNDTIVQFDYPESLIKQYKNWVVLFRSQQVTLGSLVLAYIPDVEKLSDISKEGFSELHSVITDIEVSLSKMFRYDKINYLALMMVDKQVHMHVIPRYSNSKEFNNVIFYDYGWPGIPKLETMNELDGSLKFELINHIKNHFRT